MLVAVKKIRKTKLFSRDPLKTVKSRKAKKIPLCNLVVSLHQGKSKKVKKLGHLFLSVKRHQSRDFDNTLYAEYFFTLSIDNRKSKINHIGTFNVRFVDGRACISYSELDENYCGMGIGKKAYQTIAGFFRVLESDPYGNTSVEARNVWLSLKPTRIGYRKRRFRIISNRRITCE